MKNPHRGRNVFLLLSSAFLIAAVMTLTYFSDAAPEAAETAETQTSEAAVSDAIDDSLVQVIYLTARRGNEKERTNHTWAELNARGAEYAEGAGVEAIVQIGDEYGPLPGATGYGLNIPNAIVSATGSNSAAALQKSYKLKFKKASDNTRGESTIVLKKYESDGLRFRNKLCHDIGASMGLYASKTSFVHLYVNDETEAGSSTESDAVFLDYGLFTRIEPQDKQFLLRHGLDFYGQLYEAADFDFKRNESVLMRETDPFFDPAAFDALLNRKNGGDHSKLLAMLDELNDENIPITRVFEIYFDANNYFKWLAFQIICGNGKAAREGYGLYTPRGDAPFYFMLWNQSGAFMRYEKELTDWKYELRGETVLEQYGVTPFLKITLHRRVLSEAKYREALHAEVQEVLRQFEVGMYDDQIVDYKRVAEPFVFDMPDVMHAPLNRERYDLVSKNITAEARVMYDYYTDSLKRPAPFSPGAPIREGGVIVFSWEESFMLDGGGVTYMAELAPDYMFERMLVKLDNLQAPVFTVAELTQGQYFLRVTALSEAGDSRRMDCHYKSLYNTMHAGVQCFYVLADGSVAAAGNKTEAAVSDEIGWE